MNVKIFFKRNLNFGKRLIRLHHFNALFFLVLSLTGFILFSSSFRAHFPNVRVLFKNTHVWIGIFSCLPLLFYFPKMKKHIFTLRQKKYHRINLYTVLTVLFALIISGLFLTFHRLFHPLVSSFALFIHDLTTWFGVPYVIYHTVTRSKWFKNLDNVKKTSYSQETPIVIDDHNPIYSRRTFLRILSGTIITVITLPFIVHWLKSYFPSLGRRNISKGNHFQPLPQPSPNSSPPIGGGRRGEFRYYTVTEIPDLTNKNWSFTIDGLVDNPKTLNWSEFIERERTVQVSNFHCVTGWSVYDITWEGISLSTLLQEAKFKSNAQFVKFYSADGVYTDTLTLEQAMLSDVIVAILIDGELITQNNGGPVRLIVPQMYAYKSVKWLNRIELIENEHIGYWEKRGYSKDAWVN